MLRKGSRGPEVVAWQQVLQAAQYPVMDDGVFGEATRKATIAWQEENGLTADGIVGPVTLAAVKHAERYEMIRARHYTQGNRSEVLWIVLHSTESARVKGAARSVASWFASAGAPMASAHYIVDPDEVIQGVDERAIAWTQGSANPYSIGIEIVGKASHTREQWLDDYGEPTLTRVAALVREIADRWGIPLVYVDATGILRRDLGITTHATLTEAYRVAGGHTDPGRGFPLDWVLAKAAGHDGPG